MQDLAKRRFQVKIIRRKGKRMTPETQEGTESSVREIKKNTRRKITAGEQENWVY